MKSLDFYTEDIEVVEMATGVVYKGMDKMRELARMAYRRKGYKELTYLIATDTDACLEYDARADMSEPLSVEERSSGMDGIDLSKARPSAGSFSMPICFICHFTEEGKIDRVREYWDISNITRQFGIESLLSRIYKLFMWRA